MVSLWWDTLPEDLATPLGRRLDSDVTADVAIVGAGFTGLWTAYYLLRADPSLRIALVEAKVAGFGASGRNGGWASALFPASLEAIARISGPDEARRLMRHMQWSIDEIDRVVTAEGWDVGWHKGGTVVLARTPLQWQRAQDEIAHMRTWGFGEEDHALLGASEAKAIVHATDVLGATFTPHCAAVDPARLVRHLARTVVSMGADLYEASPATSIAPGVVRTDGAMVRAPIVVRATEGYTATLAGQKRRLAPIYSMMIATEPLPATMWDSIGLVDRQTFSDGRNLIIYGQRTADGRLAFGGRGAPYHFGSRIAASQDRNADVHAGLAQVLEQMFPMITGATFTHAWGGPLGIARDWWASCGLDRSTGLAWSGGYVGDGVTTTNLGGRTLADLILEQDSDLTSLPWVDHRSPQWEPEPLRWLGANAGLQVMTRADVTEDRTGRPSRAAALVGRFLGA